MKKVLRNSSEVFHFWANQTQSEGRSGNVFFEGPSVFSYGHHFEIARIIKPGVVVFNSDRYSSSTGKHQSAARSAASHLKSYTADSLRWQGAIDHNASVDYYLKNIEEGLYRLSRARKGLDWKLDQIKGAIGTLNAYVAEFKKEIDATHRKKAAAIIARRDSPLDKKALARFKERAGADREIAKAERLKREERAATAKLVEAEALAKWKAGEDVYRSFYNSPIVLRVKGEEIQTTRGAAVPVEEARGLWTLIRAQKPVHGIKIGQYTVNGVIDGNLVVGCHTIPMREVARMAVTLGFESEAA